MWGLGNAPIPNMVHLLESKGIRVFSLAEEVREVDAFCTWYDSKPFVFLNTMKSVERSRFDAAHELGHLVRDVYSMSHGESHSPEMEREANEFAAAFLMPKESVIANRPPAFTIRYLIKLKRYWGVSLAAMAYRYSSLRQITEWSYRNLCIEIAKNGYRTTEPDPIEERETSQLFSKVLEFLQSQKIGRSEIAKKLFISIDEVNALTFNLTRLSVVSGVGSIEDASEADLKQPPTLRLV
ncbi:ImmA/IrrE family metallo-endopeptidase [Herbaspirillum sp. AP02]|nr:ImmA/IrrE family metallo-endopeptidase [Herbaspirillum sp. AP02]NZD67202.1 ImmA/IrrE family metallo-endopeptidase [Herbaspirillum sp. AP21]